MLIGQVFIRDGSLILRDVDGSEQSMPIGDALDLLAWLQEHKPELERQAAEVHARFLAGKLPYSARPNKSD